MARTPSADHVLGRKDADRDLLIEAALGDQADALVAWQRWRSSRERREIGSIASRWLPLVAQNLDAQRLDTASASMLGAAVRGAWAHNHQLLDAAQEPFDSFRRHRVPFVLLKGAALACERLPGQPVRPMGDVDILVPPSQLHAARAILADLGWRGMGEFNGLPTAVRHGFDFRKAPSGAIDVHQFLMPECCWAEADENVWTRAQQTIWHGTSLLVLHPADQLLHVCMHGLRWSPVHAATWLADAAHIVRSRSKDFPWAIAVDEACRRKIAYQLSQALTLLEHVSHLHVPSDVFAALCAGRVTWRDRLECRAKTRPLIGAGGLFHLWCSWRRLREQTSADIAFPDFVAGVVSLPDRRRLLPWALDHVRRRLHSEQ